MNYKILIFFYSIIYFCTGSLFAQHIIKGQVADKITKEILAYATVHSLSGSTVTNENGAFLLKATDSVRWISVRYVGYKTETFFVKENSENVLLYLEPIASALNEVIVSAHEDDTPYILFTGAIESFYKTSQKMSDSKAFFRSYTTVDEIYPAEMFEAYYNVKCNSLEIKDAKLKAGRFLLPKQTSFLNMSSLTLIELFKPFLNTKESIFPYTPFTMTAWRHLKRNYSIFILDKTPLENDTLVHFRFIARDSINSFSGELFYFIKKQRMEKIILKAANVATIPFVSIANRVKNKFSNLSYSIEMGFDSFQNKTLLNYIVFNYQFDANSQNQTRHIFTSMKLFLYDYGTKFQLPILHSITNKTDYQLITYFPYNNYFFTRNPEIAENDAEKQLRLAFNSIPCYDSRNENDSLPFLPKRIEHWTKDWKPDLQLVGNTPIGDSHARLKHYKYEGKKAEWDSSFASTMLYLDYDCYSDTLIFNTSALIDYKYSYLLNPDSVTIGYFAMYLDMSKIAADKMLWEARKKYSTRCPTEEEAIELYDKYNSSYELDIYNLYCNSNSKMKLTFYPSLKRLVKSNLKYAEKMTK